MQADAGNFAVISDLNDPNALEVVQRMAVAFYFKAKSRRKS
jgi:hypothetical protein